AGSLHAAARSSRVPRWRDAADAAARAPRSGRSERSPTQGMRRYAPEHARTLATLVLTRLVRVIPANWFDILFVFSVGPFNLRRGEGHRMQPATPSDGLLKNQPIVVPKASDVLAERLRQMILSGQIQPGHQLPAERELVKETSLSRASVREALRILELEGLIETRRGRGGGSVVR